jgi:hypothetical protein
MEQQKPTHEIDEKDLPALRKRLGELAADLPGTLAKLSPEVQQDYRDAEQSVIDARRHAVKHGETHWIL